MPRDTVSARRIPWLLVFLTLLLVAGVAFPADPIRNAVTGGAVGDARLDRSLWYNVLGPISSVFDAMTLFTVGQIYGFTLWIFGLFGLWCLWARRINPPTPRQELRWWAIMLGCVVVVYAAVAAMNRPMARLVVTRLDVIAVDFHSHTKYSHDGRPGWSAVDLRDWHERAGYDVAYVTDHATFDGVFDALRLDSTVAGQGMTLLPGIEAFYKGEHVNLLNAGIRFRGLTTADYRDIDTGSVRLASLIPSLEPVLVQTIPGNLAAISPAHGASTAGVRAIEIVDGSPRGMSQTRRDHDRIVHLADSLDLALVAGTDNHGWGRAAPGWTLIRIPDWRGRSPNLLSDDIELVIRAAGRKATLVIERTTASASPLGVALTMPLVIFTAARTASGAEQVAWLFWIWGPWLLLRWARRRPPAE